MSRIATILLAAGRGTRFGAMPKLLADFRGRPLVRHAAEAALAAKARPVIAVLGAHAEGVRAAIAGLDLIVVQNDAYTEGLSTSLKVGIAALPPDCEAAIVMLGDMPCVSASLIGRLMESFEAAQTKPPAIVPVRGGVRGNPVLLNVAELGGAIATLRGDRGAGPLLAGRTDVIEIAGDAGTSLDIDTPENLATLNARSNVP